ncbi:MAG: class I SAM-dependent methyltransferase [Thermodesulfobacteriota bacterium]
MKNSLNKTPQAETFKKEFLKKYLEKAPISLALIRAAECHELSKEDYLRPVLDIGCGNGLFTSILFEDTIDTGLDISSKEIREAKKTSKYKYLVASNIEQISFKDGSFSTIFSNSVLEHLTDLNKALKEIHRILKKDGTLIFTTYTEAFGDTLFYSKILAKLRLSGIAGFYSKTINQIFNHKNLFSLEEWKEILAKNGFKVIEFEHYFPEKIMNIFDLFLPFSLFNLLWVKLFLKWKPFSTKLLVKIAYFFFKSAFNDSKQIGCGLKFTLKKL